MDVSKLVEKAREAAERRNFDYSIDLYLQACKMAPDDPLPRKELRQIENRVSKEKAATFWDKAKAQALLASTHTLYLVRKYDGAMDRAEEVLKIDPGNASAMMVLGHSLLATDHLPSAIAVFEDVKNINAGGNPKRMLKALRALGRAYEAENKINEAQDIWQTVLKQVPGDREGMVKSRDLSAKSMTSLIEGAALRGQRGSAAISMQTKEQSEETQRLQREASSELRTDTDVKVAIEDAKAELQKRPNDPALYAKLGDLYRRLNDYNQAKSAYELARQRDANNFTWSFKLHDLEIWKMQNALKALEPKAKTGDKATRDKFLAEKRALLEYRLKSYLEREKQYTTDSKIRFDLGMIYFELARDRSDKSLYDEAIKRFQATFRDPKFKIESGYRMGLGFAAKAQYDLALKRFEETLVTMELKNEAWKTLMYAKGDTLQKSGKRDDAKRVFLEIYEIDVSFKDVAKRVEELGQPPAAQDGQTL